MHILALGFSFLSLPSSYFATSFSTHPTTTAATLSIFMPSLLLVFYVKATADLY